MKKITKKQIKEIREGYHDTLMECLEFLLDTYQEDKWELGYNACIADIGVHSSELAHYIVTKVVEIGETVKQLNKGSRDTIYVLDDEKQLKQIINEYFNKLINGK